MIEKEATWGRGHSRFSSGPCFLASSSPRNVNLSPRRSKSRGPPCRIAEFAFFPCDRLILRNHHLRDAVATVHGVILLPEIQQDHANLPAIAGVDGGGAVG